MKRWFALVLSTLVLASCKTPEPVPVVPNDGTRAEAPIRVVDPEVEAFFRNSEAASGTRLMAGDRIRIDVQGKPELTLTRDLPPNGEIPVLSTDKSVTPVLALGKTPQDLEQEIAKIHQKNLEHPYVTVTLETPAARSIYVLGAVKIPNAYPVTGNDRLTVLQALSMAGGYTPESDLRAVTIQRIYPRTARMEVSPPLDLALAIDRGDQRDNLLVEPGDTIVVPGLQKFAVQVLGRVKRAGPVTWFRGITLARAITEAGGFETFPKTSAIQIVRNGSVAFTVNFDDVLAGRTPDPELEPRDVINVPERWF